MTAYVLLVAAVGVERLAELVVATRNARWAFAHGGVESGRGFQRHAEHDAVLARLRQRAR